jgi:hypothetical protein
MELGNRWITAQARLPPMSAEALARTIRNQRFLKKRLDALWGALVGP